MLTRLQGPTRLKKDWPANLRQHIVVFGTQLPRGGLFGCNVMESIAPIATTKVSTVAIGIATTALTIAK